MDLAVPAAQRLVGIRSLFQNSFDVSAIAEFVLGRYRRLATPQQIQDFVPLYQEYTVQTYGRQLSYLAGSRLVLQDARPQGAETVVGSNVVTPSGGSYRVDWYAVDRGGACKIADLVIEGVSMKMSHRDEIARWIEVTAAVSHRRSRYCDNKSAEPISWGEAQRPRLEAPTRTTTPTPCPLQAARLWHAARRWDRDTRAKQRQGASFS